MVLLWVAGSNPLVCVAYGTLENKLIFEMCINICFHSWKEKTFFSIQRKRFTFPEGTRLSNKQNPGYQVNLTTTPHRDKPVYHLICVLPLFTLNCHIPGPMTLSYHQPVCTTNNLRCSDLTQTSFMLYLEMNSSVSAGGSHVPWFDLFTFKI